MTYSIDLKDGPVERCEVENNSHDLMFVYANGTHLASLHFGERAQFEPVDDAKEAQPGGAEPPGWRLKRWISKAPRALALVTA